MIGKPIDQIEKSDIEALIDNAVAEKKTIEYKQTLPGGADKDKKEFLADVSSFANAAGGDILYGIKEKRGEDGKSTGIPESADGLGGINPDQEILKFENIIRQGIEPRIPGTHFNAIDGFPNGPVIVLRIPKSWSSPHMIKFQDWNRFYSRTSNGKYPLDVTEIRSAFVLSESIGEKIQRFRDDRIGKIIANETPVKLSEKTRVVLHVIPISFADPTNQVDIASHKRQIELVRHLGFHNIGGGFRFNSNGALLTAPSGTANYFQLFRTGVIESVSSPIHHVIENRKLIPSSDFEKGLICALKEYLSLLKQLGLTSPVVILLSLLGVKGLTMGLNSPLLDPSPIDQENLILPDILLDDFELD
ncbi:MAG: helix-turn-helix domain-containing protein, partial [bacterium]